MVNRSFIKWAGGKYRSASQILNFFPKKFDRYVEPFLGSGAIFFNALPSSAVLSDINSRLISTFLSVRDDPECVVDHLRGMKNNSAEYYDIRNRFNTSCASGHLQAAQFIFLNKCGYNGLYRVNKSGEFNVPFGKRKNQPHLDEDIINECNIYLQQSELKNVGFQEALEDVGPDDFVYFDPPYLKKSDTSFTSYTSVGFTPSDHMKLAEWCERLDSQGTKFALSNSKLSLTRKIYSGWNFNILIASSSVSAGSGRGQCLEYLITNY